ncbi:glycosyltransferase family 2 protein [Frankia sp. CNm7]|uniref:Glycosyltransferase family 2 protein n=1 Tax=Frankia nepalensis TaxID=1836974 RepID=A0A937RKV7_9ACTN|nr:glycosyltransferase family 2 protein [Frankia nepalensis]MBL7497417.1 glycosyltransferase family 2 protein [Frankia nepalensis]MBL7512747.1 glycosyltransferase family 2 protein [Frankia nepalensis]MBL7517819.1 glycosyltransferase family 2 protein [Frankia nepalensis]MBL7632150.1 glycosyltransferase family 2 protein [Frankia nepalensis]
MNSLLAVVVSHGGSPHLAALLQTLVGLAGCRVVLVENKIGTRHRDVPAAVQVCSGHGNVGYGAAVNLAVRHVLADGADADGEKGEFGWLLVVNSDVTIPRDTQEMLPKLLGQAPPDVDVVGFTMRADDGGPGRSAAVLPTRRTSAFTAVRGEAAAVARWPALSYPVGAFFAIRTETFRLLDGFDPAYWLYYEETDLFARLLAAGGRITWADDTWPVRHTGGGTAGRATELQRELGRAATIYARRHRDAVGRGWLGVHAAQLALLVARKAVTGRRADATRALQILVGLVQGAALPGWEPAARSSWLAVPSRARARLAGLDG